MRVTATAVTLILILLLIYVCSLSLRVLPSLLTAIVEYILNAAFAA